MSVYYQEHSGADTDSAVNRDEAAESTECDADPVDQHHHGWSSSAEVPAFIRHTHLDRSSDGQVFRAIVSYSQGHNIQHSDTCTHIKICIPYCTHTEFLTYILAYIHTVHTYIFMCMHTNKHGYMHTDLHIY